MVELLSILLVEDNDDVVELTTRALTKANIVNPLVRVHDGVDALDYLLGRGSYAGRDQCVLPVFVLLDLNLPRLDGIDVLKAIRAHKETRNLPVMLLTSSDRDRARFAVAADPLYDWVKKPITFKQLLVVAHTLGLGWLVGNEELIQSNSTRRFI